MKTSQIGTLRLIALFKLVKAAVLIAAGIGAVKLIHADLDEVVRHWVARLCLDPDSRLVNLAIEKFINLPPHRFRQLEIVSLVYAAVFLTEGIGLWLLKRWAEWFTVFVTGSLVPIEIYEIIRHPTMIKIAALIINLAVVAYLIYRIKRDRPYESGVQDAHL